MMEKEQGFSLKFMLIGLFLFVLLFIGGIIILGRQDQNTNTQSNTSQLQLGNTSPGNNIGNGNYQDNICGVSFDYPSNWRKSSFNLPLPQKPLSQIIFDEPASGNNKAKNSILSYICYDSSKYSFDQFVEGDQNKENVSFGQTNWTRAGTFMSTVKNGKLIIFQMFFTKYDMNPQNQYESIFLNIAKSLR